MAEMTAAQVAEWMKSQGLKVPADVLKRAESEKTDEVEQYLYGKLSKIADEGNRIQRATESRVFLEQVAVSMLEFDSTEKSKPGRGDHKYTSHFVGIETPSGFLKVELQK